MIFFFVYDIICFASFIIIVLYGYDYEELYLLIILNNKKLEKLVDCVCSMHFFFVTIRILK